MVFNLNEFLMAVSFALDFVEMDILGVRTNHGKRAAYISLEMGKELDLSPEELHDIVALAILHDNGVSEKSLHNKILNGDGSIKGIEGIKDHSIISEQNVRDYPFLTDVKNVLKFHHEKYDGTGFFGLKGDEIPLISQIIRIADSIEINFNLEDADEAVKSSVISFLENGQNILFSPMLINIFYKVAEKEMFWKNLKNDIIYDSLKKNTPQFSMDLSYEKLRNVTGVFSKIIDSKSSYTRRHSRDLAERAGIMADYYNMEIDEKMKLVIAADLHDIGKLAVPNAILDSPNKLTKEEFEIIKKHPYYTRLALEQISGFEDITEWAANHHEKLNGLGYPYKKEAKDLDFNSRLLACLDIYEALIEDRPYRAPLSHKEAMEILNDMKDNGCIDPEIVNDIDIVFTQRQ